MARPGRWSPPAGSPEPVLPDDRVHLEAADARQGPPAVGDGHGDHELVGAGGVADPELDGIEVRPDERGVLVVEGDVEGRSRDRRASSPTG